MTDPLDLAYARVPEMHCKGLCVDSCSSTGVFPAEDARINDRHGITIPTGYYPDGCPALVDGRCSIYDDRPLVCRLWGTVPELPCPYGCQPVVALSTEQGQSIMRAVMEVS